MEISIKDLLELKCPYDCTGTGLTGEMIERITGMYAGDYFTHERMQIKDYMYNLVSDCRSRDVNIVFLDNIPTLFYQYVGKGDYRNIHILDRDKISELKDLIVQYFLSQQENTIDVISMDQKIEIDTYGANCTIENETLVSR